MSSEAKQFESAYKRLNTEQKTAVDTIEGPVMVIAGPGTGKTQILTLHIANILKKTDTKPENILALTFTESGARAMRERLRSYIGSEAYRVAIHTFHGFSDTLIKTYPDAYTRVVGGRPANEIEKFEAIESILESKDIRLLRPIGNPAFYVPHIIRALSIMKQEYITPDRFAEIIATQEKQLGSVKRVHEKGAHKGKVRGEYQKAEKSLKKNKELLFIYRAYDSFLTEKKLYDFEDMILETITALQDNVDMLRDLQESYQYILADEHQDVNASQNKILDLLASYHEHPNLFVVGDEKQAIYRFQGASLENFLFFEDRYKDTKTIALTENYRSGQEILDAAHSLITSHESPAAALRIPLHAQKEKTAHVSQKEFVHEAVEDDTLVEEVEELLGQGTNGDEIAVIVRTNREVEHYAALLRKKGISVRASADGDILTHPITKSIMTFIDAVCDGGNEAALFRVLHGGHWGLNDKDLFTVLSRRSYDRPLSTLITDSGTLRDIGVSDVDRFLCVGKILNAARTMEKLEPPQRVLEYLLTESGFLRAAAQYNAPEGTRVVRRLYDEIEAMVIAGSVTTLLDVQQSFRLLMEHGLSLNAPYIHTNESAVQVMTTHKSKGLEFQHVFIPHLTDALWGTRKRSEYFKIPLTTKVDEHAFDVYDDERRLLYVAMTRAKSGLHLSSSSENTGGRELSPSRLLAEIDEQYLNFETVRTKDFDPLAALTTAHKVSTIDPALIKHIFLERGLSATALNNYLRSPYDYLYRNVLRIPEIQPLHMQFGSALHSVLERVTKAHTDSGKIPSTKELITYLDRAIGRLPVSKEQFTSLHERALEALTIYLEHIAPSLPKISKEEFRLKVVLETGKKEVPEIPLTGMLDRLDFNEKGSVVRVIDYKSGKPKTRGFIEGTTKDSNGDYKRQLVFYALLLELYEDERYQCREGVLSFVEPDSKGEIHEEAYTITDKEIAELKEEIIGAAREITSGSFLREPCDPEKSAYCEFVKF